MVLVLITVCCGLLCCLQPAAADYPDVIELVGYSNRRARTHYYPYNYYGSKRSMDETPTLPPPAAKQQADLETLKKNIEKYNQLLAVDRKNLPESQKDMLDRIVERVARLKESLDIEQVPAKNVNSTDAVTEPSTGATQEAETDPTLVLDETTLLQLQNSMDELAAAQASVTAQTTRMREFGETIPTGSTTELSTDQTENDDLTAVETASTASGEYVGSTTLDEMLTDSTDAAAQFVAARSNTHNRIDAITAVDDGAETTLTTNAVGNQRTLTTSSKLTKTRATKRPGSNVTKGSSSSTSKRRPSTQKHSNKHKVSSASATTASYHKTQKPQQQQLSYQQSQQQQQQQQQLLSSAYKGGSSTPSTTSAAAAAAIASSYSPSTYGIIASSTALPPSTYSSSNQQQIANDMVYDAPHVNTSAIIDSLNNNAREEFYQQQQLKPQQPSYSGAASSNLKDKVSEIVFFLLFKMRKSLFFIFVHKILLCILPLECHQVKFYLLLLLLCI